MAGVQEATASYKLKTIEFMKRKVPVVVQNANGPCPLLALANVLLLRNQIYLAPNTPDVSQDRLVSLVAGFLLDANNDERLANANEDYRANLQQNIADAISLLPKLATGIDVNVRFHDIRAFEFTQDTAIFDLMDVRLVHGWLIDPQDKASAEAIGQHSYNELVSMLVSALGDETPPHLLTPTAIAAHSRDASFSSRPSAKHGFLSPPPQATQPPAAAMSQLNDSRPAGANSALPAESSRGSVDSLGSTLKDLRLDEDDSQQLQRALALSLAASQAEPGSTRAEAGSSARDEPLGDAAPAQAAEAASYGSIKAGPSSTGADAASSATGLAPDSLKGSALPQGMQGSSWLASPSSKPSTPSEAVAPAAALWEGGRERAPASGSNLVSKPGLENKSEPIPEQAGATSVDDWVKLPSKVEVEGASDPSRTGITTTSVGSTAAETESEPQASSSGTYSPVPRQAPARAAEDPPPAYDDIALAKGKMPAFVDVDPAEFHRHQEAVPEPALAAAPATAEKVSDFQQSEQRARDMQRANVIQEFLESTSSQLTEHGLMCLHQGLRPNELGVLFRNNHFNTFFCHANSIWILVTDQGYLFEQNVVWERLCDVSGNTEFAQSDFTRYTGKAGVQDVTAAADLAQAAFAAVVPPKGIPDPGANVDPDADMALAFQLQEEENARQQQFLAQQRQQEQQQASGRQSGQGGGSPPKQTAQGRQQQQPEAGRSVRPKSSGRRAGKQSNGKDKEDKCSIM